MTLDEVKKIIEKLRGRFDSPYSTSDKSSIEGLYYEVLGKTFRPTSCQQCYHDAVIEIYCYIKKNKIKTHLVLPKCVDFVLLCEILISRYLNRRNWHLFHIAAIRLPGFTGPVPPPLSIRFVIIITHFARNVKHLF